MYIYFNPRTRKRVVLHDRDSEVEKIMIEDKDDILIVYSSFSHTIKVFKWHPEMYAGDYESTDNIGEVSLSTILGLDLLKKKSQIKVVPEPLTEEDIQEGIRCSLMK